MSTLLSSFQTGIFRVVTSGFLMAALFTFTPACGSGGGGGGGGGGGSSDSSADCFGGEVTVWGEAPIFASKAASRSKAKKNACVKAIEKCIGSVVAKNSGVADGQSIANEIFEETKGMCRNDSIVQEKTYKLDTITMLKVFVRYKVEPTAISRGIKTAQKLAGNPKIMVMIREEYNIGRKRVNGFTSPNARAAAVLRNYLIDKGYEVISASKARVKRSDEEKLAKAAAGEGFSGSLEDKYQQLRNNAAKAGADVLIIGQLEANKQNIGQLQGTDFKSVKATGNVKIVTLWGRGKELGTYTKQANGAGTTLLAAAQAAAQRYAVGGNKRRPGKLAKFVTRKLKKEWAKVTTANQIIMNVKGVDQKWAGVFRDDLVERTAVKKVYEQGQEGESHKWEVIYPGRAFALADTLGYYGDNPAMFTVVQKTCKKITLDSVKRGEINVSFKKVPANSKFRCVSPDKL